ncbi:hypothetical protein [Chelativorans sp. YIM 93263]|uniref:hypothetical protein n=1 Tax=Chelativorans sp. YIM 93263 TaxID=2906648 RepID=UPI0023795693|nr:hypothetical protein [Chelativorans sp. YIM 93263]
MKRLLLLPAIVAFSAGTALAQSNTERQVTVDLENIEPEIAANVTVDSTSGIPSTVNVEPWLAESVCDVDSAELAAQLTAGNAYCMAVANSPELMQIVEEVMVAGYTTNDPARDTERTTGTDETVTGEIGDDDGIGDDGATDGDDDTDSGDDDTDTGGDTDDGELD